MFNEVPSSEVALHLSIKSTIQPCVEYCCDVWTSAPSYYLELLNKPEKWISRTVGLSLATSFEGLVHYQNVVNLNLFYRYILLGRCSSELTQPASLQYFLGKSTRCSDRTHDFSVTFLDVTRISNVSSFFLCRAGLWNYLPIECFSLNNDLNGFKPRISRQVLTAVSF